MSNCVLTEAQAKKLGNGDVKTTLVSSGDDLNQQFNQIENFIASDVSMIVLNAAAHFAWQPRQLRSGTTF
jgi:ABC-type sugar transport system substrate-binding protein